MSALKGMQRVGVALGRMSYLFPCGCCGSGAAESEFGRW